MLLGYNTNGLTSHRLEDALRLLADEGFRAVAWTPDVGHVDPLHATRAEIDRLAALLDRLALTCVVESGARFVLDPARKHRPNLLEDDPSERARRIALYERHLEIAQDVGAIAFSMWAGAVPSGVSPSRARQRLREGLLELLAVAEDRAVPIAFEPEPGMLIETVEDALDLRRELGDPSQLGFTLDIGHLYVTGEGDPSVVVPRLEGQLLQVHIEDMKRGVHEHLAPGEGDVDFEEAFTALDSVAYRGPVCWELSRSSHAAPAMLRRVREEFMTKCRSARSA